MKSVRTPNGYDRRLGIGAVAVVAIVAVWMGRRVESPPTAPAPLSTTAPAPPPVPSAPARPATFAGSAACAGCHEPEAAAWRVSHHDLAMQVADETTVLGDFGGARLTQFGVTSTFYRKGGKFFARTEGPDGKLADYEIAYTFGVDPLQQYLVAFPGGRLQALPIAWDTRPKAQGGQRWFHLYPDERIPPGDLLYWTGIAQNWNHMCSECHSTNVRKGFDVAENRYETTWSDVNVGCEACHGPGSNHVAWAQARARRDGQDGDPRAGLVVDLGDRDDGRWIMDLQTGIARRSSPRASHVEIETCGRCHARRARESEDYVSGRPLMDTHRVALLDEALYQADGQTKEEVYEYGSFLQSRMYAADVTCTDCHEPHSLKLRGVTDDANAVCAQCHLPTRFATPAHHHHPEGSAGGICVACHMPARSYMVVDPRRDHSIRVPRPDLTVRIGTPNACNGCHTKESPAWAADSVTRWYGPARASTPHWGETIDAGRRNLPGAEATLVRLADDRAEPAIARATAVSLLRAHVGPDSGPTLERALADPDPLIRAAALSAITEVDPRLRVRLAAPLLTDPVRTVRIDAARALASVPPDVLPEQERPYLEAALREYRAAQTMNADRPEGRLNLAVLDIERGDQGAAEREYLAALAIAPAVSSTYVNLADLYRMQGRDAEGEQVLRRGLTLAPGSADLHHALGLLLVREKRLPEALEPFARATELAPDQVRYAYVYAVALESAGQVDRALAVLERAHDQHSGDREVLAALVTMNRDRGDRTKALEWARALVAVAPQDAQVRGLLDQLTSP
ncbi:MAG: tetratricopeptide repeat protein [Candidatus Binatia bacterium]